MNTSGEEAKHGWSPEGILEEADAIAACAAVPVVGLMTMAAWGTDAETARPSFVLVRETRDRLRERTGLDLPELSMGMSGEHYRVFCSPQEPETDQSPSRFEGDAPKEPRRELIGEEYVVLTQRIHTLGIRERRIEPLPG